MIKKRYILFCVVEAVLSFVGFILLSVIFQFHANNHSILENIIIWSIPIILGYLLLALIYFFLNIKIRHVFWFGLASGYLGIMVVCLAFAKQIDDYTFLSVAGFMVGILSFIDLLIIKDNKHKEQKLIKKIPQEIYNKLSSLKASDKSKLVLLLENFIDVESFKMADAIQITKMSEKTTRKIIKYGQDIGVIREEGNNNPKRYKVII